MKKLKLFIWEDVLNDYTAGMACALAPDVETAVKLINDKATYPLELPLEKMRVIKKPEGFYVYGGG